MTTGQAPQPGGLLTLRLHGIVHAAEGICFFEFRGKPGDALPGFAPGAHIDLHLGNGMIRSYSLVNSPCEREAYRIVVKKETDGRGGSRFLHGEVRVGDDVVIGPPRNNFPLREDASHSVLIAGGIGITPIFAMIGRLEALKRSWALHYAAISPAQAAFTDALAALSSRVNFYFRSDRPNRAPLEVARIVADSPPGADFYCCGPARMMAAFAAATASLDPSHVHAEYFSAQDTPAAEGGFEVVLQQSGRKLWVQPGETILDALLRVGIDAPYSCMEGVCGTCEVRVLDGVPDHRDLILSKHEREKNDRMLICCSGAKSAVLVLDL